MGVHETSAKEHLTNFTVVRHGNKQNKIYLKMQKRTTTTTTTTKTRTTKTLQAFQNKPETTVNQKKEAH